MSKRFLSNEILTAYLRLLTPDERRVLAEQMGVGSGASCSDIVSHFSQSASNAVLNLFSTSATPNGYLDLLLQHTPAEEPAPSPPAAAKPVLTIEQRMNEMKSERARAYSSKQVKAGFELVRLDPYGSFAVELIDDYEGTLAFAESRLVQRIIRVAFNQLTPAQREQYGDALRANLPKHEQDNVHLYMAGGALVIGNLGGFGTYVAMSSLLSVLSAGLLPFGAYTAASTAMAIVLGPIGWTTLAAVVIKKLGEPDRNRVTMMAAMLAMARLALRERVEAHEQALLFVQRSVDNFASYKRQLAHTPRGHSVLDQREKLALKREEERGQSLLDAAISALSDRN